MKRDPIKRARLVSAVAGVLLLAALQAYWGATRYRRFSPDGYNYLSTARNVARGEGLVQDSVGFNDPRPLPELFQVKPPLTAQAPLYPLLVGGLFAAGIPLEWAGYGTAALGFAMAALAAMWLAREAFGQEAAAYGGAVACLLSTALFESGVRPWSESCAIASMLLCLALLLKAKRPDPRSREAVLAGVAASLAFAFRFALWPLLPFGFFSMLVMKQPRGAVLFAVGGLGAVVPVLRNWILTGSPSGAPRLPSLEPLSLNAQNALGAFIRDAAFGAPIVSLCIAIAAVLMLRKSGSSGRGLLGAWICLYAGALVLQRTLVHFDPVGARLMAPSVIPWLIVGVCALVVLVPRAAWWLLMVVFMVRGADLIQASRQEPETNLAREVRRSAKAIWVRDTANPEDLLITDDGVDLSYMLDRRTVSASAYPYSAFLTWQEVCAADATARSKGHVIYIVMNKHDGWKAERWLADFGPVFGELASGKKEKAEIVARLEDAWVYRPLCAEADRAAAPRWK